jgi:hypothetical protein
MLTSRLPAGLRSEPLKRLATSQRDRSERKRVRREHDVAMASDHRFAIEHGVQTRRSIDLGKGGCPFCE